MILAQFWRPNIAIEPDHGNGLANSPFHRLVFGINELRSGRMLLLCKSLVSGTTCATVVQLNVATVFHAVAARKKRERVTSP